LPLSLLPTRRRQVRGVREAGTYHHEEDAISGICMHRPFPKPFKLQLQRRLFSSSVLGLRVPIKQIPQELTRPLSVKRAVFEDGLLFSAFAATGTIQLWRLDRLSILLPSEVLITRPSPVTALLPLRGPRPSSYLLVSAPGHSMTLGASSCV